MYHLQCVAYAADRQEAPDKSVDSLSDEQLAALYDHRSSRQYYFECCRNGLDM
jgi:hypothetical protein